MVDPIDAAAVILHNLSCVTNSTVLTSNGALPLSLPMLL